MNAAAIQARHARLVAALQRQFTDDLQSAIEDSPRPNDASAGSVRCGVSVFKARAHTLRFDVLQTLPDDQLPSERRRVIARPGVLDPSRRCPS